MNPSYILTIRCNDAVGIVAAAASALASADAFITESSHFGDEETGLFFMRTVFRPTGTRFVTLDDFREVMAPVARRFAAELKLFLSDERLKVLLAVSKQGHCLNHLLHQWHAGELPIDVVGVVSNHEDMRRMVDWYDIPYHYLPMAGDKAGQEGRILQVVRDSGAQLTVLARYMQILSDDMCRQLEGRCINIHHSFLPSFKGARPYHQAHERGVKLIGATAHYVTAELDEGPIIEQEVARVDHAATPARLVEVGRDLECIALARAVGWHLDHRVLRNGHRTVVFP